MTFLALTGFQAALLALITAGAIVGLYFLKLRHRRMVVASSLLWARVLDERQAQSLWEKLRRADLDYRRRSHRPPHCDGRSPTGDPLADRRRRTYAAGSGYFPLNARAHAAMEVRAGNMLSRQPFAR